MYYFSRAVTGLLHVLNYTGIKLEDLLWLYFTTLRCVFFLLVNLNELCFRLLLFLLNHLPNFEKKQHLCPRDTWLKTTPQAIKYTCGLAKKAFISLSCAPGGDAALRSLPAADTEHTRVKNFSPVHREFQILFPAPIQPSHRAVQTLVSKP